MNSLLNILLLISILYVSAEQSPDHQYPGLLIDYHHLRFGSYNLLSESIKATGVTPGGMTIVASRLDANPIVVTEVTTDDPATVVNVYSGHFARNMTDNFLTELRADSKFPQYFPFAAVTFMIKSGNATVYFKPVNSPDCGPSSIMVSTYLEWSKSIPQNTNCTYEIIWPEGREMHIESRINEVADSKSVRFESNSNIFPFSYGFGLFNVEKKITYLAPGGAILFVNTAAGPTSLSMILQVINATRDAVVETTEVVAGSQPIVLTTDSLKLGTTYVYTSKSWITMDVMWVEDNYYEQRARNVNYLDRVRLFDGQGREALAFGTLGLPMSSLGNTITIFPTSTAQLAGVVVINNKDNQAMLCRREDGCYGYGRVDYHLSQFGHNLSPKSIKATGNIPGAMTIVSFGRSGIPAYPIVTEIETDDPATVVNVYSGYVTSNMTDNFITELRANSTFPQHYYATTAVTFVIKSGKAIVHFKPNPLTK